MTVNMFLILLVVFASVSTLLTEALKKFFENLKKDASANLIALIDAIVVGGGGSVGVFIWLGIAFTPANIVAIVALVMCVWIGSMIGYDKVVQLVKQLIEEKNK